ncbi:MAG: flagellar hook-associated protein FlgK [Magnetococcus sp. YQC-5]
MSLSNILNVSKQGILASQGTLQTISHNIANVNTPGYSRQRVDLESSQSPQSPTSTNGVRIGDLRQQLDQLVDRRMELGTGELGRLETQDHYLQLVEHVFNTLESQGLDQRLSAFFDAADHLADNPGNTVARYQLVANGDALAREFNTMQAALSEKSLPLDKEIDVTLADINSRLKDLQTINQVISRNNATNPALDLKDKRRQMVLELGKLIDVRTMEKDNGDLQVMTASGQELLADEHSSATFARSPSVTATGFQGIRIGDREIPSERIQGGRLKGLLELRDQVIHGPNGVATQLDLLAGEIRFQVNQVHSQSASKGLVTSITSGMALGNDLLDTPMTDLVTDPTSANYQQAPVDLRRIQDGTIFFATGPNGDTLKALNAVNIIKNMNLKEVINAFNEVEGLSAKIDENDNKLKISSKTQGEKIAVISDRTGLLAALGMGALFGGTGAADMRVNPDLLKNSDLLAMGRLNVDSLTAPTKVSFDDTNSRGALELGNLRATRIQLFKDNATLTGHYANMVGELGAKVKQNKESLTAQDAAQSFIADVRESISGVSLEEELTDLMRFQRAFQASSKMVGVADELMQTIIQMV